LGQCIVAFAVALAEMLLRLDSCVFAPLYALFWVGPSALIIEMWLDSRRERNVTPNPVLSSGATGI
jgi:hypothetical protein